MRILLVEDDSRVASFIRRGLREENYAVDVAADGERALFLAQTEEYDVIILDLLIPKKSGLEVLTELRAAGQKTPVLILTAKDERQDKVAGLDKGADDSLPKPFAFEELLARLRALLRRRGDLVQTTLRVGDLELDALKRQVTRGGKEILLTNREFALLEYLMRNLNRVVTRTLLAEHVWEHDFDPLSNVIDVHVARLRQKIDGNSSVKLIETVRGRGYLLKARGKK